MRSKFHLLNSICYNGFITKLAVRGVKEIITMIIEVCALIGRKLRHISLYNHLVRGDYNTEALIFKMATMQFLDVFTENTSKMKENAVALIIT